MNFDEIYNSELPSLFVDVAWSLFKLSLAKLFVNSFVQLLLNIILPLRDLIKHQTGHLTGRNVYSGAMIIKLFGRETVQKRRCHYQEVVLQY